MRIRQKASAYLAVFLLLLNIAVGLWHPVPVVAEDKTVAKISASVIDAATIKIDSITVTQYGFDHTLGERVKSSGISSLGDLNNLISNSDAIGSYKNDNIEDAFKKNSLAPCGFKYFKNTCDNTKDKRSLIKINNNQEFELSDLYLRIGALDCVGIFSDTTAGDIIFTKDLGDPWKMMVWFNWTSANTMVRVDGRDGDFTQNDPNFPNTFYSKHRGPNLADGKPDINGGPLECADNVTVDGGSSVNQHYNLATAHDGYNRAVFSRSCFPVKDARSLATLVGDIDKKKLDAPAAGNGSGGPARTCESNNGSIIIGWIICGVINLLDSAVTTAGNTVNTMLDTKAEDYTQNGQLRAVWSLFRALSSFALVGIALVMIIGQAMGGNS